MQAKNIDEFIRENAPCYIYQKEIIDKSCQKLQEKFENIEFLYSIKANPFMPVIKTIKENGIGSDAASSNEVLLSTKAGMEKNHIYYSAPGKTMEDLQKAWDKCIFIADSFHELDLLDELAKNHGEILEIGIRVNPNYSMTDKKAHSSKFGIDEDKIFSFDWTYKNLKLVGIHVHVQSQILDTNLLSNYYKNTYDLAVKFSKLSHVDIKFINFGSGIGVAYDKKNEDDVNLDILAKTMKDLYEKNRNELGAKFLIESGRFLVMDSGVYYTPIIDKKYSNGKTYLVVKNAMNGFVKGPMKEMLKQALGYECEKAFEPLYTGKNQCEFEIIGENSQKEIVDIGGHLCTSLDLLASDIELKKANIGDILKVSNAGAYCFSLSILHFASHDLPKEFLI
ncbi:MULTISPECIES: diaminopimelate decarboxylase family protein [Anaerococcus]|uniref:diaminopimelate decarboxylase family protein n=1 Tax=Anaerococcus TaxID=165779 RepID=UPI00242D5EA9|nr:MULTISPECIES: diaminopimelate decarboxylase [Anaerococcus]MDD7766853.1 diaminopimelate decarboxylase [Anaerococcus vaginalis]MDY6127252.1 diaminopimelate decarboxylase [Anaerococcus sp.]